MLKKYKCSDKPFKTTVIYCLKNPIDRNRIFYVGKTTQKLNTRLLGHINKPTSERMSVIIKSILKAGKRPTIHELDVCTGFHQVYTRERFWVAHYNKRKTKLLNAPFSRRKPNGRVYW